MYASTTSSPAILGNHQRARQIGDRSLGDGVDESGDLGVGGRDHLGAAVGAAEVDLVEQYVTASSGYITSRIAIQVIQAPLLAHSIPKTTERPQKRQEPPSQRPLIGAVKGHEYRNPRRARSTSLNRRDLSACITSRPPTKTPRVYSPFLGLPVLPGSTVRSVWGYRGSRRVRRGCPGPKCGRPAFAAFGGWSALVGAGLSGFGGGRH